MVKKLSCVSNGSLKRFPHTFTTVTELLTDLQTVTELRTDLQTVVTIFGN